MQGGHRSAPLTATAASDAVLVTAGPGSAPRGSSARDMAPVVAV